MPAKKKVMSSKKAPSQKKAPSRKTSGRKSTKKDTSAMVSSASTTSTQCEDNCLTTQNQAIAYMNNEILWSRIFTEAWTDSSLFEEMKQAADNANDFLQRQATRLGMEVNIPDGVTTKIIFDTVSVVHLLMPAVQNIPARSVDMVPHAL